MKKNIIAATIIAAVTASSAVAAADGQINFTGSVIDTSCNVTNASSGSLDVIMGQVSKSAFSTTNTAAATKFTLQVTSCPATTNGGVSVSFDGTSVAGNNSILALTKGAGVASGIGIQLSDASQNVLPLNTVSTKYNLTSGAANLDFVARYIATGVATDVTSGAANAVASFSIIYN